MNNDTITINGFDLSEVIRIIEIIRPVGNVRSIATNDAPLLGVNLQEVRTGAKIIKVKFAMQERNGMTLEQAKHTLAGVFNTSEAVRIIISDEPDKYYMGLVAGSVDMDNVTRWFQKGEFELLIPDGVAHSTTYRKFDNGTVQSDKIVFSLINDGNVPAFPIVTVKHNAENGYLGLVNTSGVLEIGDREEADKEVIRRSETLFDYRDNRITTGLSAATPNAAILNDTSQSLRGTVGSVDWSGRKHLFLQNAGGTTGNNAGSLTWNIPADSSGAKGSLNDYIWWRQVFWLGAANQYGFIKLTVSDEQGRFLYGVETYKRYNGLGCEYNFMAANGKGGYNMLKQWTFIGTHLDHHNPFNEPRGWSDLKRNDDKVTVYWWGSYNRFTIPEIKGRKSTKVHVAFGALGNKPLVTRMYLDSIMYRKDFVPVTRDIPNRYPVGSNVVLNSENDTVTVDGLGRIVDMVHGSTFLTIPPGKSTLEVYPSSWVRTKPTVKVEFEERYL
ncbi:MULTISPECIES: distal tail protein Dit [unclassified Streptococcus]|uniref:distal tail protein Dit n=2 Tax=unclassified Streptococcus TaxID=2608887 RepID=UPI00211B2CDB|nr:MULTISPECIES: distal tail protein Dit [unclassified Streptococcus]MCQ9212288.1 phage tail family protein [Streptococcus sp. B01]MCQ9213619.1 phage tail family protein [Streptococcus sp. O1]